MRFTIRDVLWLTVVVGLDIAAGCQRASQRPADDKALSNRECISQPVA